MVYDTEPIYIKYTATEAIATCTIINGNPILKYSINERWNFSFSKSPSATRFADAQMIVPFPPRQAPKARAHHKKLASNHCKAK